MILFTYLQERVFINEKDKVCFQVNKILIFKLLLKIACYSFTLDDNFIILVWGE